MEDLRLTVGLVREPEPDEGIERERRVAYPRSAAEGSVSHDRDTPTRSLTGSPCVTMQISRRTPPNG